MVVIGGVKFYRSKNGNLYRHGIVKAQRYVPPHDVHRPLTYRISRRSGVVKKVNVPCRVFSTTGISLFLREPQKPKTAGYDFHVARPWYVIWRKGRPTDKTKLPRSISSSRFLSKRSAVPLHTRPIQGSRLQGLSTKRRMRKRRRLRSLPRPDAGADADLFAFREG